MCVVHRRSSISRYAFVVAHLLDRHRETKTNKPVKRPREHEVIVGGQLAQAGGELALVDQPTGLVDDCEGEDGPERGAAR